MAKLKKEKKKVAPRGAQAKTKKVVRKVAKVKPVPKAVVHVAAKPKKLTPAKHKAIPKRKPAALPPIAEQKPQEAAVIPKLKPSLKKKSAFIAPAIKEKPPEAIIIPKREAIIPPPAIKEKPKEEKVISKETPAPKKEVLPVKVIPKPEPLKVGPKVQVEIEAAPVLNEIELQLPITVKDLAVKLQDKPSFLIKNLMDMGIMVGMNQALDEQAVTKICAKYKYRIKKAPSAEEQALLTHREPDKPQDLQTCSPIVTIMGHVDHGKTSLLDAIRKSKVAESEHGGITQHIGAYRVMLANGEITFLDTPGHEAFTAMRMRGAGVTNIVVLVVAADDGIMPQTLESIDHARAAGVSIIVAVNKIDKPQADVDRVKKQLSEIGLTAEDWGGKTITVPVSAKTGQGIDNLLEMILLEAQMLELKSNPNRPARGVVIEAKMSKGRGPVSTLLIQNGTLHLNENIIVGNLFGKIRAMFNDRGQSVTGARPSVPVEVLGIAGVPQAGEQFFVIADEKQAKELALARQEREKAQQVKVVKRISLEDLHAQISEGKLKELKIIIKADVQGSLEAIKDTLGKLSVSEIKLDVIHTGVGNINTSDAILAAASNALILGFNVVTDDLARELVAKEGVSVKTYNIIYELANEIKAAVEGMLEPKLKKVFLGRAEIRKIFKLSRAGTVAGCFVTKGKINRTSTINLVRNGAIVFEGKLSSLKRFKDDVRDVQEGFECGMSLTGFDQIMEGDIIEAYEIEKIARKL